jgi:hypothetical protein
MMPWDNHECIPGNEDEDGNIWCILCGIGISGPVVEEAKELSKLFDEMARGRGNT